MNLALEFIDQRYGVYVGQTSKTIEERFIEHKSGNKSGKGLEKNGVQLMRSLWLHGKVRGGKRFYYETKVHVTLEEVIPKVTGDINEDLCKWYFDSLLIHWWSKNQQKTPLSDYILEK